MILILGPDGSGKTTLAQELSRATGRHIYHFTMDTSYLEFLQPMADMLHLNAILDRAFICEFPYSSVLDRPLKFNHKQEDNLNWLTQAFNPLIILCTHKPPRDQYHDTVLPYDKWDDCLKAYQLSLSHLGLSWCEYNWSSPIPISKLLDVERWRLNLIKWWIPMWASGYGGIGSHTPKIVYVAEVLSPLNLRHLPFEEGPSGHYLSDLVHQSNMPLNSLWLTNWLKTKEIKHDSSLLEQELIKLKPMGVVILGAIARAAIPVIKNLNLPYTELPHPSGIVRFRPREKASYLQAWARAYQQLTGGAHEQQSEFSFKIV